MSAVQTSGASTEGGSTRSRGSTGSRGSTSSTGSRGSTASRLRRLLPWVVLVLATAIVAAVLSSPRTGELFEPTNPEENGGQALARVLEQQGVDVQLVHGSTPLSEGAVRVGPGTTVLLPHTSYLGPESGPALVAELADADRLVVLVPSLEQTPGEALGLDLDVAWGGSTTVAADCTSPLVREGDRITRWDVLLSAGGDERAGVTACFPPGPGHNAGGAREGALLTFPATEDRPTITVAALTSSWTNAVITQEANAALALRLLGGSERLVWVLPQPADAQLDGASTLWEVLPRYLTSWVWLLGAAVLALAAWQGRRLGPVVTEPLPAVVHASETTRSRGRLYRQAKDRGHALRAAQAGTRRRLAPRLGLPRSSDPERLVAAVADATGLPVEEVRGLLLEGLPADDPALVGRVRELRSLEEELRA